MRDTCIRMLKKEDLNVKCVKVQYAKMFLPPASFAPSIWIVMSLLNEHLNRDNSSAPLAVKVPRSIPGKGKRKKKQTALFSSKGNIERHFISQ